MSHLPQRWMIEQHLELISPLHLGTGEDTLSDAGEWLPALSQNHNKQPHIPGASIKGALRSFAKRSGLPQNIETQLFGHDGETRQAGRVQFLGGTATNHHTITRTRVAIDRQTSTAVDKKLFNVQAVNAGARFTLTYILENASEDTAQQLADLLSQAPQDNLFALGAFTNQGFGRVKNTQAIQCKQFGQAEMNAWWGDGACKPWQHYAKLKSLPSNAKLRPPQYCQLHIEVECTSPFIVKEPTAKGQTKSLNTAEPQLLNGRALLPSSALRGRLRTQAERILRTLCPETPIEQGHESAAHRKGERHHDLAAILFGTAGWKGLIALSDFVDKNTSQLEQQEMLAIDRFTGGGKDGAKYRIQYAVNPTLQGNLSLNLQRWEAMKDNSQAPAALGLLSLVLRDWAEGDIALGFGASKGFGKNRNPNLLPQWEQALVQLTPYQNSKSAINSTLEDLRLYLGLPSPQPACLATQDNSTSLNLTAAKQKIDSTKKSDQFFNPYHFIPLTQTEAEKWPRFDDAKRERGHHQYQGLSGKIICQITLATPSFVGNSQQESTVDQQPNIAEHFRYNGELAFPATSLRGMISSLFEPISRSNMRVLENSAHTIKKYPDKHKVAQSTAEMIAGFDKNLLPYGQQGREAKLSPVEILFGFVEDKQATGSLSDQPAAAIAGRVRMSHALPAEGVALLADEAVILKELSSPSPIAKDNPSPVPPFYFTKYNATHKVLGQPLKSGDEMLGSNSTFGPKGWKRYLHALRNLGSNTPTVFKLSPNGNINNKDGKMPWECQAGPDGHKRRVKIKPLQQGQQLYFDIDFDNLTQTELAQLCATLAPSEHFEHKIGLGKPIGLGSIKITPLRLHLVNRAQRYSEDNINANRYHQIWHNPKTLLDNPRYSDEADQQGERLPDTVFRQLVAEGLSTTTADIRTALQLTGDPHFINQPVHYPQLMGQQLEAEHFKWFNEFHAINKKDKKPNAHINDSKLDNLGEDHKALKPLPR